MARKLTQDMDIVKYRPAAVLPVPTQEWEFIKKKIGRIKPSLNVFLSLGFFCLGASLTAFYRARSASFPQDTPSTMSVDHVVAWMIVVVALFLAVSSFTFAWFRRRDTTQSVDDIIEYLQLIEQRHDFDSPSKN